MLLVDFQLGVVACVVGDDVDAMRAHVPAVARHCAGINLCNAGDLAVGELVHVDHDGDLLAGLIIELGSHGAGRLELMD